jgi:acylphosphatase
MSDAKMNWSFMPARMLLAAAIGGNAIAAALRCWPSALNCWHAGGCAGWRPLAFDGDSTTMAGQPIRRSVYYSGRVQGVGFRYTARKIAQNYAISGFVRNLPDRRVELIVEGEAAEIQRFLTDLAETMRDNIHDAQTTQATPTGEFNGFDIRHEA